MKTSKKILISILTVNMLFTLSCKKDRIEDEVNTDYASTSDFYNDYAPEEQVFIIDSLGGDTIIGNQGTHIWGVPKTIFMYKSNFQDIFYPFELRLIEAYSIKDKIMSQIPDIAQTKVIKSGGQLKITGYKNNLELALKDSCGLPMWAPSATTPDANMGIFYGFTNGTTDDWNNDVLQTDYLHSADNVTSVNVSGSGYLARISKLGWLDIGCFTNYTNFASVSVAATGTNTNNIDVYIIFNDLHSFVKVNSLAASNLPEGEAITVFAIAKDTDGVMYYYKQDYTLTNGLVINLNMVSSTESQVLTIMGTL